MFLTPVLDFTVYAAAASPSEISDPISPEEDPDLESEPTAITISDGDYTLDYLYEYFKLKVLNDVPATASEAQSALLDSETGEVEGEIFPLSDTSVSMLSLSDDNFVNCVRFDGSIGGSDCTLLFPAEYESAFYVDGNNQLWNMTNSTVQGVVLYDSFSPTSYQGYLIYLTPCLGNNFSTNYNYGSPNYIRHYYVSSGRVTYDTEYVTVTISDSPFIFRSGDILQYILILIGGAMLLCLWKKSVR